MNYSEYALPMPFSEYIECVWIYTSGYQIASDSHLWLPNGTFDLVFNLEESYKRINIFNQNQFDLVKSNALIGQMKESVKIQLGKSCKVIGVRFKAYGLFAWLGIPIKEITGLTLQLSEILGQKANELEQKIRDSKSDHQILLSIIQYFRVDYKPDLIVIDAVREILKNKGTIKINNLISKYNISQKTLENRFGNIVGIMPKELSRIYRFNHYLISSLNKNNRNLTTLAYECDFFDQSHLNHDFKRITAKSPKQFFKEQSDLIKINKESMFKRFEENY
jgi:AraC-like DNA-binding protein